jgi:sulfite oxidase
MTTTSDRREFLVSSSALLAAAAMLRTTRAAGEPVKTVSAAEFIPGKDSRLIVHSAKTGEIETPLELLRQKPITPKEFLFVRNNQVQPADLTLAAADDDSWQIELSGLLDKLATITVADLKKLPQIDVELVLQCSGNGRALYAESVAAEGAPWQQGAMGNVVFRGVPLAKVLEHLGVKPTAAAKFLAAEGRDAPSDKAGADFEHSLPLGDVLERSLLALSLNGESMPRVHGGPVRLVTPGYYATMNVKWLTRLRFEDRESENHHHVGRYRTPLNQLKPGTPFKSTLDNSEPNWRMRIKSTIFAPLAGETVKAGEVEIRGVAWNDGAVPLAAVEVSIDNGQTWQKTKLHLKANVDANAGGAAVPSYAWQHWKHSVQLPAGEHKILSRAIDVLGRAQPLDGSISWNPQGYAWHGVDAVTVKVV